MINGFLSELGKKLAERWLTLLLLPGALYLAIAATAHALGHTHPADLPRLTEQITRWANEPAVESVGGQVVLLAAVLAGAAAAGCTAQGLATLVERAILAPDWQDWPRPLRHLVDRWVTRRRKRWEDHARTWHRHRTEAADARALGQRANPTERRAAYRAMTHIAPEHPQRPTWCGDRLNAVAVRLARDHRLDLATCWPHLWLNLPEPTRAEITTARQSLDRATSITAWALLYLPLACWWWPAALLSLILTAAGWRRARTATETYALLLEAATLLHSRDLADHLGLDTAMPRDELGDNLTRLLEGTPPPHPDLHS